MPYGQVIRRSIKGLHNRARILLRFRRRLTDFHLLMSGRWRGKTLHRSQPQCLSESHYVVVIGLSVVCHGFGPELSLSNQLQYYLNSHFCLSNSMSMTNLPLSPPEEPQGFHARRDHAALFAGLQNPMTRPYGARCPHTQVDRQHALHHLHFPKVLPFLLQVSDVVASYEAAESVVTLCNPFPLGTSINSGHNIQTIVESLDAKKTYGLFPNLQVIVSAPSLTGWDICRPHWD